MQVLYFYFIAIFVTAFSLLILNFFDLYEELKKSDLKKIEHDKD
jgi:hypothetical protein